MRVLDGFNTIFRPFLRFDKNQLFLPKGGFAVLTLAATISKIRKLTFDSELAGFQPHKLFSAKYTVHMDKLVTLFMYRDRA